MEVIHRPYHGYGDLIQFLRHGINRPDRVCLARRGAATRVISLAEWNRATAKEPTRSRLSPKQWEASSWPSPLRQRVFFTKHSNEGPLISCIELQLACYDV